MIVYFCDPSAECEVAIRWDENEEEVSIKSRMLGQDEILTYRLNNSELEELKEFINKIPME